MQSSKLAIPLDEIRRYCQSQPIQRLALFGSILREDFADESDIDVLVDFFPTAKITYFDLFDIQESLQNIFQRDVDLLTPNALSEYFREDVLNQAELIYEASA